MPGALVHPCACVQESTTPRAADLGTCHPQRPPLSPPAFTTQDSCLVPLGPQLGGHPPAGRVPSELSWPGWARRPHSPGRGGQQEAPGQPSPGCSDTSAAFLRRGGSRDGKAKQVGLGRKQTFRSCPTVRVLKEKAGAGASVSTGRLSGRPLRAAGQAALVPGVVAASVRLPVPGALPGAASSGPPALTHVLPNLLLFLPRLLSPVPRLCPRPSVPAPRIP